MMVWKRLLFAALCPCMVCTLWPAQAEAANSLPVTFSTNGVSYQYANSDKSVAAVTYGTKTANKTIGSTKSTPVIYGEPIGALDSTTADGTKIGTITVTLG